MHLCLVIRFVCLHYMWMRCGRRHWGPRGCVLATTLKCFYGPLDGNRFGADGRGGRRDPLTPGAQKKAGASVTGAEPDRVIGADSLAAVAQT